MAVIRDDELEAAIGRRVQSMIAQAEWRQQDVAADIGLTSNQMSDRVHGKTRWSVVELYAVASVIVCDVRDLLP